VTETLLTRCDYIALCGIEAVQKKRFRLQKRGARRIDAQLVCAQFREKRESDIDITSDDDPLIPGHSTGQMNSHSALANSMTCVVLAVLLAAAGMIGRVSNHMISSPGANGIGQLRSASPQESTFVEKIRETIDSEYKGPFVPLIINNEGKLLCPKMESDTAITRRTKHFVQMLRIGLQTHRQRLLSRYGHIMNDHLPILLMGGDGNGCNVMKREEGFDFPRLSWSMPSQQHHGSEWCHAIGMPSYELWNAFGKVNISDAIETHERIYP
jgi:hypothetical protein